MAVAGLSTCTDFRGTVPILAPVYRFWEMQEFLALADFILFLPVYPKPPRILHILPVRALHCRYKYSTVCHEQGLAAYR